MAEWRFHAFTVLGDGKTTLAVSDIDLSSPAVVRDLSGPGEVSGSIAPEILRYKTPTGEPAFLPYRTLIAAEYTGRIVAAGILEELAIDGPSLSLTAPGLITALLKNTAHMGSFSAIEVDPLNVVREQIIHHAQSQDGGDLGITVDPLTTDVRIGEEERDVEFTTGDGEEVSFTAGPYILAWWATDDLGKEFDDLAAETPFDYLLESKWSGDTELSHHLNLGHPTIGTRRSNLRFMEGENITIELAHTYAGEDYASEVLVLGAGEGRKMVRGTAKRSTGRMRRTRVVTDKSITSRKRADAAAEAELKRALGESDLDEVTVANHPNAPFFSYDVGDEIYIQWPDGWEPAGGLWVRILSMSFQPDSDQVVLSVARVEKV